MGSSLLYPGANLLTVVEAGQSFSANFGLSFDWRELMSVVRPAEPPDLRRGNGLDIGAVAYREPCGLAQAFVNQFTSIVLTTLSDIGPATHHKLAGFRLREHAAASRPI